MPRSSEGSVIKATDGSGYYARLRYTDSNGKLREKKRKCLTRKQAAHRIADLRSEIESVRSNSRTYLELDTFYRKTYLHAAVFSGSNKVSGFRQDLRIIEIYLDRAFDHFGKRDLEDISYSDLRDYKFKIATSPVIRGNQPARQRSVSDINHHLRQLRRLFNVAIEQGWIVENPFRRGPSLITESIEVERTRVLTREEEARLLAACDKFRRHLRPLLIFAIETGLRRGEIQTLRWSSVDLEKRFLRVESRNSKTLRSRLVPLSQRALETAAQLRHNSTNGLNGFVFGSSDFKKAFIGACSDAGLEDVHFHDLRHTAITRMLERGISPPLVMKISGHSQMKTFMRYVNQTESSILDIAKQLDRAA